jgi:phospholipid/cholesterol/gamma-HCH transport system ATP-binding protein
MKKVIDVRHLRASYGNHQVLKDVSFSCVNGQITVLLGSSGSGKTTVFKHLLGFHEVPPDVIEVLGQDIAVLDEDEKTALYLKLGVFYQNGALISSLTIGENIALPLQQHTDLTPALIDRLVRLKLNMVNLDGSYNLYPSELSGGMLKRAALARAIVMDPPLVFCDEPGAGLDPVSLASLDELFRSLNRQLNISFLIVTHELSSIRRIADKVVFLEDGMVAYEGSVEDVHLSKSERIQKYFSY